MKKALLLLTCLLKTTTSHGRSFFADCLDPVTGMLRGCIDQYRVPKLEGDYERKGDEVVSIRRSGDDTIILKFDGGHLEDYHQRPNGT